MSKIDPKKLQNVVQKGGKTIARCPACAARGGDAKGEHLVVYPDGKFGCVVNSQDKKHNSLILELAGCDAEEEYQVPVKRVVHPPSKIIQIVGRFGRSLETAPSARVSEVDPNKAFIEEIPKEQETRPKRPAEPPAQTMVSGPPVVLGNSSRPQVPLKILQDRKRLIWLPEGGFDPDVLDEGGNPTLIIPNMILRR